MADKELETVIAIDLTSYVGADGKLTPEGIAKTREGLLTGLRLRFPRAPDEGLNKLVEEMMVGAETLSARELKVSLAARSLISTVRKFAKNLDGLPHELLNLAQLIDSQREDDKHEGAHIFTCGQASNDLMTAIMCLQSAAQSLEAMLNCECGQESSATDGEKLN